jgi:Xaa-Pro aminopeptidase
MTFHCSTSLRDVGVFGVTVGDTMAVTATGCEVLTSGSRELRVVPA